MRIICKEPRACCDVNVCQFTERWQQKKYVIKMNCKFGTWFILKTWIACVVENIFLLIWNRKKKKEKMSLSIFCNDKMYMSLNAHFCRSQTPIDSISSRRRLSSFFIQYWTIKCFTLRFHHFLSLKLNNSNNNKICKQL